MFHLKYLKAGAALAVCLAAVLPATAQLMINGVVDKTAYDNSVTFTVVTQPGFTYSVLLNTSSVPAGVAVTVNQPDYYELSLQRTEIATSVVSNRLIRFIVAASDRSGSEWGLPRQVPWPIIQSSTNEFVGASLRLMAPTDFPADYEIPIVAWLATGDIPQRPVRANGLLAAPGHPSIQIRRGVGAGFLGSTNPPGELSYLPRWGDTRI